MARLRDTCSRLLHDERGIALPVAMLITVIGLGLAAIPIMASVNAQSGDKRDLSSDTALTAADSAVDIALNRQTQMSSSLTTTKPCVKKNGSKLEPAEKLPSGWCPPVPTTGTEAVGGSNFSYQVKPGTGTLSVLATGSSSAGGGSSVTRRLLVSATPNGSTPPPVFGLEGVIGIDSVTMSNGASIKGNVGTNGSITMTGGTTIQSCTAVRVGPSGSLNTSNGASASCPTEKGEREYPNVVVPAENSNGRMFTAGGDTYTYSGGAIAGCGAQSWQTQWCPTTKTLELRNQATVVLGGTSAPYVFCKVWLEGDGHIKVKAGARIQIIFDSPENCGQSSGTVQLLLSNGSSIEAEGTNSGEIRAGLYFVGSSTRATTAKFEGGAVATNFVLYGPRTAIDLSNGVPFNGAMLGKTVTMQGGTAIRPESSSFNPDENLPAETKGGSVTGFKPGAYIECSATTTGSEPNSGC